MPKEQDRPLHGVGDVTAYELANHDDDSDYETLTNISCATSLSVDTSAWDRSFSQRSRSIVHCSVSRPGSNATLRIHKVAEGVECLEVIDETKELKLMNVATDETKPKRRIGFFLRGKKKSVEDSADESATETPHDSLASRFVRMSFGRKKKEKTSVDDDTEKLIGRDWRLTDPSSLELSADVLGAGAFSTVYRAVNFDRTVAVKIPNVEISAHWKINVADEIEAMKGIGQHVNVVGLFGVSWYGDVPALCLEYCENGNLLNYLHVAQQAISGNMQLSLSVQICEGMMFISSKGFVHRELAAQSIYLTSQMVPKIGDFGSATYLGRKVEQHGLTLLLKRTAPEAISDGLFSVKSDVWSFGVLLHEIFSFGETPFKNISDEELLHSLSDIKRLLRFAVCPDLITEVMNQCWNLLPSKRPSFRAIRDRLTSAMLPN